MTRNDVFKQERVFHIKCWLVPFLDLRPSIHQGFERFARFLSFYKYIILIIFIENDYFLTNFFLRK